MCLLEKRNLKTFCNLHKLNQIDFHQAINPQLTSAIEGYNVCEQKYLVN